MSSRKSSSSSSESENSSSERQLEDNHKESIDSNPELHKNNDDKTCSVPIIDINPSYEPAPKPENSSSSSSEKKKSKKKHSSRKRKSKKYESSSSDSNSDYKKKKEKKIPETESTKRNNNEAILLSKTPTTNSGPKTVVKKKSYRLEPKEKIIMVNSRNAGIFVWCKSLLFIVFFIINPITILIIIFQCCGCLGSRRLSKLFIVIYEIVTILEFIAIICLLGILHLYIDDMYVRLAFIFLFIVLVMNLITLYFFTSLLIRVYKLKNGQRDEILNKACKKKNCCAEYILCYMA